MERTEVFTVMDIDLEDRLSALTFEPLSDPEEQVVMAVLMEQFKGKTFITNLLKQWHEVDDREPDRVRYGVSYGFEDHGLLLVGKFVYTPKAEFSLHIANEAMIGLQLKLYFENRRHELMQLHHIYKPSESLNNNLEQIEQVIESAQREMRTSGNLIHLHWFKLEQGLLKLAPQIGLKQALQLQTLPTLTHKMTSMLRASSTPFFFGLIRTLEKYQQTGLSYVESIDKLVGTLFEQGTIRDEYDARHFVDWLTAQTLSNQLA